VLKETAVQGKKTSVFFGKFQNNRSISGKYDDNTDFNFAEDYSQSAAFDVFMIEAKDSTDENNFSVDKVTFYYPSDIINSKTVTDSVKIKFSKFYFSENNVIEDAANYVKNYRSTFISEYQKAKKAGEVFTPWENDIIGDIVYNQNNILTFALHSNSFSGGAHGNYADIFYIIDLKSGKELKKDDIFISGSSGKLSKIIFQKIKEKRGISDSEMSEMYETKLLPVSTNIYVTQTGVGFCYNPYEITAYANGSDDVLIPYSEIKNLLKPDFIAKLKIK
jgi:hypothetical protein